MSKNDGQGAFNATFNNISDLHIMDVSLRKLKYTEKNTDLTRHWQTWSHTVVYSTPHHRQLLIKLTTLEVICTDYISTCKIHIVTHNPFSVR
jgi:hypothetical protein